jgi:hypothetical protein
MANPVLANYATQEPIQLKTANAGTQGGVVQLSLGSADIEPLTASGEDVIPFINGAYVSGFTRILYTAATDEMLMNVPVPANDTGTNNSSILLMASGYAAQGQDYSTALAKPGPYTTAPADDCVISYYPMLSSASISIDTIGGNTLTLVGSPTTTGSTIISVPGTTISPPGVALAFDGIKQYAYTEAAVTSALFAASGFAEFSISGSVEIPSFPAVPLSFQQTGGAKLAISSGGTLSFSCPNGNTVTATTAISTGTLTFEVSSNPQFTNVYVGGVLLISGGGQVNGLYGTAQTAEKMFLAGDATQSSKQTFALQGSPTGGTFTVTFPFGGVEDTATITYPSSHASMQTTFTALGNVGSGNLAVTGTVSATVTLQTQGALANTPVGTIIISQAGLTGGTASSSNAIITNTAPLTACTWDNIKILCECDAPEDALAQYQCAAPPVPLSAKRKLQRIGTGSTAGQLIGPPLIGFGSPNGLGESGSLFFPGGRMFPSLSSSPIYWLWGVTSEYNAGGYPTIGLAWCTSSVPTAATISVGATAYIGGPGAVTGVTGTGGYNSSLLAIDPVTGLIVWYFVGNYLNDPNAMYALTTSDMANFNGPYTVIAAGALENCVSSGVGITGIANPTLLTQYTSGGAVANYVMIIEGSINNINASTGGIFALTLPSLTNGGSPSYSATLSAPLIAGFSDWTSPGSYQTPTHSYLTGNVYTQYNTMIAQSDLVDLTSWNIQTTPIFEAALLYEYEGAAAGGDDAGIGNPRMNYANGSAYLFQTVGGTSELTYPAYIGLATYPGTWDQLFSTGSLTQTAGAQATMNQQFGPITATTGNQFAPSAPTMVTVTGTPVNNVSVNVTVPADSPAASTQVKFAIWWQAVQNGPILSGGNGQARGHSAPFPIPTGNGSGSVFDFDVPYAIYAFGFSAENVSDNTARTVTFNGTYGQLNRG